MPCQFLHHHGNPVFYLTNDLFIYLPVHLNYQWINCSQSNQVFNQSYCDIVPFNTVDLFFLKKITLSVCLKGGGSAFHCFSFCHDQLQK